MEEEIKTETGTELRTPDATEATETNTAPSSTTEVEDASKITEAPEDTSPKVDDTASEVTEENQAGETVKEGEEEKIPQEKIDVTKPTRPKRVSGTMHKTKKKKSSVPVQYAYNAANYEVDEKNIFAKTHNNIFTENINIFGQPRQSAFGPVVSFSSSGGEEGEEEEPYGYQPSSYEYLPDDSLIDRDAYIDEYRILLTKKTPLRQKNGILHKKLSEYYRSRKNERVFDDIDPRNVDDLQFKYERKIDEFYEFRVQLQREREGIEKEIYDMRNQRDEQRIELEETFRMMLLRETDVATGLINTKTGKTISDKLISKLIQRQTTKSTQIGEVRLGFIKKREQVHAIEAALKSLETIGDSLHLIDFEQIRMENQTFTDKIEERDDELLRLRARFSTAIQELTHTRLKTHVVEEKLAYLAEGTAEVEEEVSQIREYLSNLKIRRDKNRSKTTKLHFNSGLLTQTKLLNDMEITMNNLAEFEKVYEELNTINKDTRQKITILRHNIEVAESEHWLEKNSQPQSESNLNKKSSKKKSCLPNLTVMSV